MDKLILAIEYAYFQPENKLEDLIDVLETLCLEAGRPDVARKARDLDSEGLYEDAVQAGYEDGHSAGYAEATEENEKDDDDEATEATEGDAEPTFTAAELEKARKEGYESGLKKATSWAPKRKTPQGPSLIEQRFGKKR